MIRVTPTQSAAPFEIWFFQYPKGLFLHCVIVANWNPFDFREILTYKRTLYFVSKPFHIIGLSKSDLCANHYCFDLCHAVCIIRVTNHVRKTSIRTRCLVRSTNQKIDPLVSDYNGYTQYSEIDFFKISFVLGNIST